MLRVFSFVLIVLMGAYSYAADVKTVPMTEQQKIDALLDSLDNPNVTFIRNDELHSGAWAKQHLKEKLQEMKDVKTAEDFITKVASQSRATGKPYIIRWEEECGIKCRTQMESSKWLHGELTNIEKKQ